MRFISERIRKTYEEIGRYVYSNTLNIDNYKFIAGKYDNIDEIKNENMTNGLSEELVNMFLNYIPIYAKGTRVLLSNYQTGFIKNINLLEMKKTS